MLTLLGGIILLSVTFILCWPVSYHIFLVSRERLEYRLQLGLPILYYTLSNTGGTEYSKFTIAGINIKGKRKRRCEKTTCKKKETASRKGLSESLAFYRDLLTGENLRYVYHFLRELIMVLKPSLFYLDIEAGCGEPDLDGMALALYYFLKGCYPDLSLSWKTIWDKKGFEAEGEISGKVVLVQFLWVLLKFLLSLKTLRLLLVFKKQKKTVKKAQGEI